jgi:hypothetical protein
MAESVTDFNCSRSEQIFQFKNSNGGPRRLEQKLSATFLFA